MDFARNHAPYSNRNVAVDLGAPNGNTGADLSGDGFADGVLQETFNANDIWGYYYYQGTSMAAPHVTGAVGLLRSCVPQATRADVRAALESTADDLGTAGFDTTYGNGFLQIRDAMDALATQYGQDAANGCAFVGAPQQKGDRATVFARHHSARRFPGQAPAASYAARTIRRGRSLEP